MNTITQEPNPYFGGIPNRRGNARFPVREEVSYKLIPSSKAAPLTGGGQTLNIGSGGILFTTQEKLPVGRSVEISVNWPARLDGTCPLKFVATGKVVRSDAGKAAVRIDKYEFKTRGSGTGARIPLPVILQPHAALKHQY